MSEFDDEAERQRKRDNQQRYRDRKKQQKFCVTLELDLVKAARALRRAGLIHSWDEDNKEKMSLVIAQLAKAIFEGDLDNISLRVTGNASDF